MSNLCPNCNVGSLSRDVRDYQYVYKGQSCTINQLSGEHCDHCHECIVDDLDADRIHAEMTAFNRKVNSELIDCQFIRNVRKKLALTQLEFDSVVSRGGVNAFSRYERGTVAPSFGTAQLIRLLDRRPDLLPEIRALAA